MGTIKYAIPDGCKQIAIDTDESGKVTCVLFEHGEPSEFLCKETGKIENKPVVGDLSVLWDDGENSSAIIAKVADWYIDDGGVIYMANNEVSYRNAVRFRNDNQYEKILGYGKER